MHLATLGTEAIIGVQKVGGCGLLAVFTIPHRLHDPATLLWREWLRGAWSHMTHRAAWRSWCRKWGVEDWCGGTEVPHSLTSGFHPHDNVVMLVPGRASLDDDALEDMQDELYLLWRDALRSVGCDRYVSPDHGVALRVVDDAQALGSYAFKLGLEFSAPSGLKEGRGESSVECRDLPLWLAERCGSENVRDVAERDPQVRVRVAAWLEYAEASKGAQVFRCSEGFYRWTGAEKMTVDQIRATAGRLQREDRQRLARALGQEVDGGSKGFPPTGDDDEVDDAPPLAVMDEEAFVEGQGAYWDPTGRGSGVVVLDLLQSKVRRVAFHAVVSSMIRRHGPELAMRMVAASMGRPPGVWRDERGTIHVRYRCHDPTWQPVAVDQEEAA